MKQPRHGKYYTKAYRSWCAMKQRCLNKNNDAYNRYGWAWRWICQEWIDSFQQFYADMWECPEWMSLDRIDNDKWYSPDNCRWATRKEQQNNTRKNVYVDYRWDKVPLKTFSSLCWLADIRVRYLMWDGLSGDEIIEYVLKPRIKKIISRTRPKLFDLITEEVYNNERTPENDESYMPLKYYICGDKTEYYLK